MARALVTGGAGFIGSHLVERLIERRRTASPSSTICRPAAAPTSAASSGQPEFELIEGTVLDAELVERLVGRGGRRLPPRRGRRRRLGAAPPAALARNQHPGHRARPARVRRRRRRPARADRLDLRGVRQERQGRAGRRRRSRARLGAPVALVLRVGQGHRRGVRARVLARAAPAGDRRAPVQHGRRAPDGSLRHGRAALRALGDAQRAAARLRRRPANALLHQRARRRARAGHADATRRRRRARSSTSASPTRSASSTWRDA